MKVTNNPTTRKRLKIGITVLVMVIVFVFAACGGTPPASTPAPQPEPAAEPAPPPPPAPTPPPVQEPLRNVLILDGARNYTVKSGDTLVEISKQFYNNGYYYPVIFIANLTKLQDADKIEPDTQLVIPDLQRNLNDAGARIVVKQALLGSIPFEHSRNRDRTADGMLEVSNSL
jgi:hypothetical protein